MYSCDCTNKMNERSSLVKKEDLEDNICPDIVDINIMRGDGGAFYAELAAVGNKVFYIHHSQIDCPAIKNGVRKGMYYEDEQYNTFCSKCMNDDLVLMWERWYKDSGAIMFAEFERTLKEVNIKRGK